MTGPEPIRPAMHDAAPPLTLHRRIREDLHERIVRGVLRPDDRVPSESALMAHYGVSRITVRQALADLQSARMILKVPGKGSFVARPTPFQDLGRLQGFAEAMSARGHDIANRVVGLASVPAPEAVAERLGLAPGTRVIEVRRVRLLDGRPASVDLSWLPARLGDRLRREELATRDLFLILEDLGTPLGHADLAIDATTADGDIAALLEVAPGSPVLRIERLTHDREGRPIDHELLHCRPDSVQYRLRLHRG